VGAAVAVAAGIGLLVWGLLRTTDGEPQQVVGIDAPSPTAVTASEPPELRFVTFKPGETVSGARSGFFFIDPQTGATEGWLPADESVFLTRGPMTPDGRLIIFTCYRIDTTRRAFDCANAQEDWPTYYQLDTQTGQVRTLPLGRDYISLSPDGKTVVIASDAGIGFAPANTPEDARIVLPDRIAVRPRSVFWSPDSALALVSTLSGTFLISASGSEVEQISIHGIRSAAWAPDGSKVAMVARITSEQPDTDFGVRVYNRDGELLWQAATEYATYNPRWSPDGAQLAVEAHVPSAEQPRKLRTILLTVFDGLSGTLLYRVTGVRSCFTSPWTADGSRLVLLATEPFRHVLVDPLESSVRDLPLNVIPTPFDASAGIVLSFDSESIWSFEVVDFETGERTRLAATTLSPDWHADHDPLFVQGRVFFSAPHFGHGGCGEGLQLEDPTVAIERPPFDY
jgi:dipeptidyl aminopeptidase/acylaminoacyl peptidase